MTKAILALCAFILLSGCCTRDLFARRAGVCSWGSVTPSGGDQIVYMEISPRHLSSKLAKPVRESKWDEIRNDIWIEIKFGEQTRLADISRETLREYEAKEIKGRRPRPDDYSDYRGMDHFRISGFTFWFDGDTLKGIEINRFHFPPGMKEARPRIGSISRGTSLSIPASVEEFEAVFGAADEVSRTYQSL